MAHLLLIVLLLAGIILAVALVQTKTNIFPHAQEAIVAPQTALHLLQGSGVNPNARAINPPPDVFRPGDDIQVHVAVSSDIEAANTFSAVVSYPKDLLEVTSIIKETLVLPMKDKYPKIDSHLAGLIDSSSRAEFAKSQTMRLDGNGRVLVNIRVDKAGLTAADLNYQTLGFTELVKSETYLEVDGFIPVDNLIKMAENPHVIAILSNFEPENNRPLDTAGNATATSAQTIPSSACGVACTDAKQCQGAKDGCTACLPNDQGTGSICRPAEQSKLCAQVITRACHTISDPNCPSDERLTVACSAPKEECKDFPTPCDVPQGWIVEGPNRSPSPSFCGGIAGIQCSAGYTCRLDDPPDPSDRSGICEPNQTSPSPSCKPRPACLDSNPRCMIPETADMCPPNVQQDVQNYFIQLWLPDTGFNNDTGTVTLSGGVRNPGIKTTPPNKPIMATIVFKAKKVGEARLDFTENSLILGSSGNSNLLTAKNGLSISIKDQTKPTVPGDIDGDGVVGFKDFSILLSKWGSDDKTADINSDGKINIFDFSILLTNWTGRKK